MKNIIFILIIAILATSAKPEERSNDGGCTVSQECQEEVENYKVCLRLAGLDRTRDGTATGPCITCPDESNCCCASDGPGPSGRSEGICGISQGCLNEIDNCQGQDRNNILDSSLGCADGSRCWCFMQ